MRGKIEQAKDSQSGKTLGVKIGERWYSTKDFEMRSMVGKMIDFEPTSSEYNGKTMWWLNDYVLCDNTPNPGSANHPLGSPVGVPRNDGLSYLPMTSNLVAHAIAAGLITQPAQIATWAGAAFAAAKNVVEGVVVTQAPEDFDDDIPF